MPQMGYALHELRLVKTVVKANASRKTQISLLIKVSIFAFRLNVVWAMRIFQIHVLAILHIFIDWFDFACRRYV